MLDTFVERQSLTIKGNRILIGLRLLLATVTLAVLLIQEFELARRKILPPMPYLSPAGLVALIVCVLTVLYSLGARNREMATKLAVLQVFVDLGLISVLVWHTGGVSSQFVVLYLISICAAAFVLNYKFSILAAATASSLFSLVTLLYTFDVIPESFKIEFPGQAAHLKNLILLDFVRLLLLPACAFFLSGVLAGTLSRKLAMERLMHEEILEGIGEGILVLSPDMKVLYRNNEFQRLFGAECRMGRTTVDELFGKGVAAQAELTLKNKTIHRTEINHRRANNSTLPLSIRMIPIVENEVPKAHGVILAIDDITAERKMEEYLKHRQRIETIGHVSATIAHEIRNPLASIRGAVQEISRNLTLPEPKKVLLDIVVSESDRLEQIITDFLRFARMRQPKLALTDIGRVLADVKLILAQRPDARGATITLEGDEGEPFAADAEQLRQLFLNLGVNALQAMDGRDGRVLALRVEVTKLHAARGFAREELFGRMDRPGVLVEIEDTGCGMPASLGHQIFEPFFTTKVAGTGLGLAIVERIVQSHDGMITVDSKEGKGTVFSIWLPADLAIGASVSGGRVAIIGKSNVA